LALEVLVEQQVEETVHHGVDRMDVQVEQQLFQQLQQVEVGKV
jgi:hypothetical protein